MRPLASLLVAALAVSPLAAGSPSGRRLGEARPVVLEDGREVYGALPTLTETTPLAELLRDPQRFAGRLLRLRGTVGGVCQKRGCWMTLRQDGEQVQVRFRDYGFFVPLDLAGREAVVEGTARVEVVSQATRRHLAEDAGRPPAEIAAIRGDERSLQVVADAVEVLGPAR